MAAKTIKKCHNITLTTTATTLTAVTAMQTKTLKKQATIKNNRIINLTAAATQTNTIKQQATIKNKHKIILKKQQQRK